MKLNRIRRKEHAVYSPELSKKSGDERYVIIDDETGWVSNSANGYGFRSIAKACACHNGYLYYAYKNSSARVYGMAYEPEALEYLQRTPDVLTVFDQYSWEFYKQEPDGNVLAERFAEREIFLEYSVYELVDAWKELQRRRRYRGEHI